MSFSVCLRLLLFTTGYAVTSVTALYSSSSPVKVLAAAEFNKNVVNGKDPVYIVEFFADWCGHCKQFVPEYEKAAEALEGVVPVVAVSDKSVMGSLGIQGFPTIKARVKGQWHEFKGARTASAVVDFALAELSSSVKSKLGGKKGPGPSEVVVLTDRNFDEKVMKDDKNTWFVEFYAPWCGHCKSLAPEWEKTAHELKGKVKVGKLDATTETVISARFEVNGFPTLILFPQGTKTDNVANRYDGPRRTSDLVSYALEHAAVQAKADQLLNDEQFKEDCGHGLCVLTFLPHIIDSLAKGRNEYLEVLSHILRASATMPLKFLWTQGGDHFGLEEQLHLAFGYPAVVAVNLERQKYTVHRGDFGQESIRTFLTNLMTGGAPVNDLPTLQALKTVKAWDGKDAPPIKEDEL